MRMTSPIDNNRAKKNPPKIPWRVYQEEEAIRCVECKKLTAIFDGGGHKKEKEGLFLEKYSQNKRKNEVVKK
ncbi:Uncharacterised protein [Chlamydia abortus]|nr:Uncharacterised protein [Chlamydia abortus]